MSAEDASQLRAARESLLEAALMMARFATDTGRRTDLDAAIEMFGFDRAELERELTAEIAAGEL